MTQSNKEIVLEVLKRAFIDRDPTVVNQYFAPNYKQHNPVIPDGPSAIAEMIPTLTALTYEPGMAVADGDLVMVHGRYTGWGPKPMVAVDIFRVEDGKVVEHWDVLQEEVPLGVGEAAVVVRMPLGDAVLGQCDQLIVFRRTEDDERREDRLEYVAVAPEHEPGELGQVVRDEVDLSLVLEPGPVEGLRAVPQSDDFGRREDVDAAQIDVGVA